MASLDVVAAAIVREGLVLCARRGPGGPDAGKWEFPGGKARPREEPEAALRREIAEELGCPVRVGGLLTDTASARIRLRVYMCSLIDDDDAASSQPIALEHAELRWVSPLTLRELDWAPADLPAMRALSNPPDRRGP